MRINFSKNELKTIHSSLCADRHLFEEAALSALKNISVNPNEYYKYSDILALTLNPLIKKVEKYLDECNN